MNPKKHYKIGICGHFGGDRQFFDGQTVKTKNVTSALELVYGKDCICTSDTYGGVKAVFRCLHDLLLMLKNCDNIVILPAHNSVRIFPPFLVFFNKFYHKKLHYLVIGGWLPSLIKNNWFLKCVLKKLDSIMVETSIMKELLSNCGFHNVEILKNFKDLTPIDAKELLVDNGGILRICTFSRVMEQKGITDIIVAINAVNEKYKRIIYNLDVYGPVENEYADSFDEMIKKSCGSVQYKGCVPSEKSVDILRDYHFLAFPTRFFTEGIPGTIIDAYAAGIPVLSSRWESYRDIIDEDETGWSYGFENINDLIEKLEYLHNNPSIIENMKLNCLRKSKDYLPKNAVKPLLERLEK